MLKKLAAFLAASYCALAMAAVDVNTAAAPDLEGIKGIGPGMSTKILEARKSARFNDWNDLIERVSGIGEARAAKLSEAGLRVNGTAFGAPEPEKKVTGKK